MAEPLVPLGYSGDMVTWDQMEGEETWYKLDSEFRRRFKAMSIAAAEDGVRLGVGTGWRIQPTNPDGSCKPGFACPGDSYHEGFPANGVAGGALAIDTVPEEGWPWMEAHCAEYGLRTFRDVNDEPWHGQPSDIPTGRDFRSEPFDLATWPLPNEEEEVTDEDINKIVDKVVAQVKRELPPSVWNWPIDTIRDDEGKRQAAKYWLHRDFLVSRQYLGAYSGNDPPKISLLQRIDANVKKLIDRK